MRRVWGKLRPNIVEYIACEPDDTWYYIALPLKEDGEPPNYDGEKAQPVPRSSAIRKVKSWDWPCSDEELEEYEEDPIPLEVEEGWIEAEIYVKWP